MITSVVRRVIFTVLTAAFALSVCGNDSVQEKSFVLVIDPGHGGEDPGAVSGRLSEKTLNLEVALALGALIEKEMADVEVLYTRRDDRAVGLAARGDFANRAGADLFLSIHTNSFRTAGSYGSETYVMGMDKNEANLEVAKLENEVIKYEDDYTETYAGFDPNSTELSIVFGMLQYANFESSLAFARIIQKHYARNTPLRDRGAKQGPFAVLWKPTMPRVLVEMGFISNESDRRYIFSDKGKQAIVRTLYDAFREYRGIAGPGSATVPASTTPPAAATRPASSQAAAPPPPATSNTPAQATSNTPAPTTSNTPAAPTAAPATPGTEFYVQLAATRARVSTSDGVWGSYRGRIVERTADGWYKYSLGPYPTREGAARELEQARRGKYPGAFIVEIERTK
jgi:N-acetylmuramoyl-L-alanine amidase